MKNNRVINAHTQFFYQQGVTLIVALVMLLIMTTAGITIISGATLQERIAGNQRQQVVARLNADAALLAAENYLDDRHSGGSFETNQLVTDFNTTNGLYQTVAISGGNAAVAPDANLRAGTAAWDNSNSQQGNNTNQRYIIEYIGAVDESGYGGSLDPNEQSLSSSRKVFRITAWGQGDDSNVESILESYYFEASQQ